MSFGITKTIPAGEGMEQVDRLYDGSLREYEFHMAGKPSNRRSWLRFSTRRATNTRTSDPGCGAACGSNPGPRTVCAPSFNHTSLLPSPQNGHGSPPLLTIRVRHPPLAVGKYAPIVAMSAARLLRTGTVSCKSKRPNCRHRCVIVKRHDDRGAKWQGQKDQWRSF